MSARGFSLVEVLVAFAIVAVAAGAALQALSSGFGGARRAEAATARLLLARSMIEAAGVETPLAEGVSDGALPGGARWRLSVARIDVPAEAGGPGLWRVDLDLAGGEGPAVALSALRFGG